MTTERTICASHYDAVTREYPDADMSRLERGRKCGRCVFCTGRPAGLRELAREREDKARNGYNTSHARRKAHRDSAAAMRAEAARLEREDRAKRRAT